MNENILPVVRGRQDSPILIIGHSLPFNQSTTGNLKELLDRRHVIYKSIVLPLKYYINQRLIEDYCCSLPIDNQEDIFRYINCYRFINNELKVDYRVIEDEINKSTIKVIICLGHEVYWDINQKLRITINLRNLGIRSKDGKIRELGKCFDWAIKNKCNGKYILPILHNSSNLNFQYTDRFIPPYEDFNNQYPSYDAYVGEKIARILNEDEDIRNEFLIKLKVD